MILSPGRRIEVERDAELLPVGQELGVVLVGDFLGSHPLLVGSNHDRGSVHIRARDHQDLVAGQAVIPGEDVRGKVCPGQVSQMAGA